MRINKPTIGSDKAAPFVSRGSRNPPEKWDDYPRATRAPQQYGYGVTPHNMVTPRDPFTYRAGVAPMQLNVARATAKQNVPGPANNGLLRPPFTKRSI